MKLETYIDIIIYCWIKNCIPLKLFLYVSAQGKVLMVSFVQFSLTGLNLQHDSVRAGMFFLWSLEYLNVRM